MDPNAVFRSATALHQTGRLDEAAALYEQLLAHFPEHPDTLQLRALIDVHQGRYQDALARFDQALKVQPNFPAAHANRAAALIGLERYAEAAISAQRALDQDPGLRGAFTNLAAALNHAGRSDEALDVCERAFAQGIAEPQLYQIRAAALEKLGRIEDAQRSVAAANNQPTADDFVRDALALLENKALIPALAACEKALALDSRSFSALFARARVLFALQRYQDAINDCDRALAVDPDSADIYALRGLTFMELKQAERAFADFEVVLDIDPDFKFIAGEAMLLALRNCAWDGLAQKTADLLSAIDAGKLPAQPFVLNSLPATPVQHRVLAERYFAAQHPETGKPAPQPRSSGGKIRIGYFSSDFHEHPVGQLIVGLLEGHDRSRFEIVAFAFGGSPDSPNKKRIARACDEFIDVFAMTDAEIAALAREKRIHIAVDLNGYTFNNRTGIFAAGAAPVQVNYLGYPSTMGTPYHHYIIGDAKVTPPEHYEGYSERIVTMPDTYLVTNDIKRHIPARLSTRAELGLPESGFAFCSFNAPFKITPDAFDVWMRLLNAVEGSMLWLNDPGPIAKRNLQREAKDRGVGPERLIFAPRTPGLEYLARYRVADLFLDTFCYNAHATACEALLVGLPVVTRLGPAFPGRVGASLLTALGMPEMIAADATQYERIALELARHPAALAEVRAKLARNTATYPLFDTKRYTRALESAYSAMWARSEQGLPPGHIVAESDGARM
jgi:predicted O-linked N-acetylglucosamine transferase (SPINDLY family)